MDFFCRFFEILFFLPLHYKENVSLVLEYCIYIKKNNIPIYCWLCVFASEWSIQPMYRTAVAIAVTIADAFIVFVSVWQCFFFLSSLSSFFSFHFIRFLFNSCCGSSYSMTLCIRSLLCIRRHRHYIGEVPCLRLVRCDSFPTLCHFVTLSIYFIKRNDKKKNKKKNGKKILYDLIQPICCGFIKRKIAKQINHQKM